MSLNIAITGSDTTAVEVATHVVHAAMQDAGFANTAVFSTDTGEPVDTTPDRSLLDLAVKANPEILKTKVCIVNEVNETAEEGLEEPEAPAAEEELDA